MIRRRLAVALTLTAAVIACHPAAKSNSSGSAPIGIASGTVGLWSADGGFPFTLSNDAGALLTLEADSFQVGRVRALDDTLSYDPYWLLHSDSTFTAGPPPGLHWTQTESLQVTDGGAGVLALNLALDDGSTARVVITAAAPDRLDASLVPDSATPVAFLKLRLHVSSTERFYGLGEWFDSVEHRGKIRPMQLEPDLDIESSDTENHVTVPLLLSTHSWGVFLDSRRPGVFDVTNSDPTQVDIIFGTTTDSAAGLPFHLFAAPSPLDLLHHYFDLTGAPTLPAPWALGPLLWRDDDVNQAQVESDIDQIRALGLATSGIWDDRPYSTAVESFDFIPAEYPDAGAMLAHAHAQGLRMALWNAPYSEVAAQPFHDEIVDAGYFPPVSGTELNTWSPPIDFTNPGAVGYWQSHLRNYTDLGFEGFKLDYGEDVVPGVGGGRDVWQFFDGSDERTESSLFTLRYHQAYAALLPAGEYLLLCRAGKWGDQVNGPIIWPGDLDATLTSFLESFTPTDGGSPIVGVGGLPSALRGGISLAVSGFPFFASDTGGYRHSPADKETWIRWVEQSALGTAMETGDASSQMPWDRDAESLSVYQAFAALHLRLFPYVWTYAQQLRSAGRPIVRPLGFAYPTLDAPPDDEFLLGDSLFVAPVVVAGATSRSVVFPPGTWLSWWDGSTHSGTETFAAPLDTLPLFVAPGSIIPMLRPTAVTLASATDPSVDAFGNDPGVLTVMLFAGTGSFSVYDGTALSQTPTTFEVTPGTVYAEGVAVVWTGVAQPSAILDGSTPISGSSWTSASGGTLTFPLGPGPHSIALSP